MANDVVKLTWAADGEADEASLDLLDFVQGLMLTDSGWIPQIASGDQATVTETMTFYAHALSHDQLAGYVQVLDEWIVRVNWAHDFTQRQFVWLNARWKSETEIRRAVVYSLAYSLGNESSPFGPYLRDDSFVPTLTVVIVRGAYWEDTALTQCTHAGNINALGGTATFISGGGAYPVPGDVPARISDFNVNYNVGAALQFFWFGWRTSRNGVLANFEPVWELEDAGWLNNIAHGSAFDDTTIAGAEIDTDFSGGATLLTRAVISTSDVTANTVDQRGMYTCLLRAQMNDTSIARVRVSSGFLNTPYYVNPRVTVQGSAGWTLYPMGVVRIPAIPREYTSMALIDEAAIIIDAERVSGTGKLQMDCLILIPYNDAYTEADNGGGTNLHIMTNPDYTSTAFTVPGTKQAGLSPNAWGMPAYGEQPLLVGAAQQSVISTSDDMQVVMKITPRWRTLRGTEG